MRSTNKAVLCFSKGLLTSLLSLSGLFFHVGLSHAATPDLPVVVKAEASTRGLLFEIKKGKNVAYLFGSIHIAKADFYPMSPKVEAAYLQADTLAVEADVSDTQAAQAMMPKLMYAAPDNLEKHLQPGTWTALSNMLGSHAQQMQFLKPAMVVSVFAIEVGKQLGYDPMQGIDVHYIQRAKADKKTLIELESLAFQGDVLGGLSDEEGDAMLADTLKSMKEKTIKSELESIVSAWKSADASAIANLFVESGNKNPGAKKLMKLLLDDRNEGMVLKINKLISDGKKPFIVVGAGHLAGEMSIVDLLKKQGLQVTQIK